MIDRSSESYARARVQISQRGKFLSQQAAEVGDIPAVVDPAFREDCERSLLFFLEQFKESTGLKPFCDDQKTAVSILESAICHGGRFVNVEPRGFGKTSRVTRAALWALLTGRRRSVVVFASSAPAAKELLSQAKLILLSERWLLDTFPEYIYPIRKIDNKPLRAMHQLYKGTSTFAQWKDDKLVLPTLVDGDRYLTQCAVFQSKSITASRGLSTTSPDGSVLRPDLYLFDDPQTDDDAASHTKTQRIVTTIKRGVLRGGSHIKTTACVMTVTPIQPDDTAHTFMSDSAWMLTRYPMLKSLPNKEATDLWEGKYASLRRSFTKDDPLSQQRAIAAATQFYKDNRETMDAGAQAAWEHCFNYEDGSEISAVQHAMNIKIDDPEAFETECQTQVFQPDDGQVRLHWKAVAARTNRLNRYETPADCVYVTSKIDVHEGVLCYVTTAWLNSLRGYVVDYGFYPDQKTRSFKFRKPRFTLAAAASPGSDEAAAIYEGLEHLADIILDREYLSESGVSHSVSLLGIDSGYESNTIYRFCRESRHRARLVPTKGRGVRARDRPISEWRTQVGSRKGEECVLQSPAKGRIRLLTFDSNHYKNLVTQALLSPTSNIFNLSLYKVESPVEHHGIYGRHCSSEIPVRVSTDERTAFEYTLPPSRPDNHLFDCQCGSMALASLLGVARGGGTLTRRRRRRKVTYG